MKLVHRGLSVDEHGEVMVTLEMVSGNGLLTSEYMRAKRDEEAVMAFEDFVQAQKPAARPWVPVTDYSFEARKAIEGIHPQLIEEVFQPCEILDVGCGFGHLVRLLRDVRNGFHVCGMDVTPPTTDHREWYTQGDITDPALRAFARSDPPHDIEGHELVICREVLEHLTVLQIKQAVRNLVKLSSRYVYLTTRFCKSPQHLLSIDASDDLDPTHITLLSKPFLRTLFILEGCKSRPDLEIKMDHKGLGRCLVLEVPA